MMKEFIKDVIPFVIIIVVVILIRSFIITPVMVSGTSMEPTLEENEILLLSKISYYNKDIKRFDIVVIDNNDNNNDKLIKRVIGLPGDTVKYVDNILYINGKQIEENFDHGNTEDFTLVKISGHQEIPKDYYLVLGDNREVSADSRKYGLFNIDQIKGKVVYRIWPLSKFNSIK